MWKGKCGVVYGDVGFYLDGSMVSYMAVLKDLFVSDYSFSSFLCQLLWSPCAVSLVTQYANVVSCFKAGPRKVKSGHTIF